ncbi:hypothetical protein [Nostoc sp. MG11]|uniref:hypothetical protein n=1 Tax=Nostoc sp. MG11 TaxID=2721166 RepID=UPI00186945AB|nr:hypothetical protein [Nostoc sp. MG11]
MLVIVTVIETVTSEAHINIQNGLSEFAIKQHITDLYNSESIQHCFEISDVKFESISATLVRQQDLTDSISASNELSQFPQS